MTRYSYSQISTYAACPLKYKLRYQDCLMPLQEGGRHDLDFGSAMHDALSVLYSPGGAITKAREAFALSYPISRYPDPLPAWSQGKSYAGGLSAISQYIDHWRQEDEHWQILSVERMNATADDGEER